LARLEVLPDNPAEADFFPLPDGYSLDPEPFTDTQLAELKGLFALSSLDDSRRGWLGLARPGGPFTGVVFRLQGRQRPGWRAGWPGFHGARVFLP
jgi:hypothetical protein